MIHCPPDLGFQDRVCLFLPSLFGLSLHPRFGCREAPQHQRCGLGERPLQMLVADLTSAYSFDLPGAFVGTRHQSRVGKEVPDLGKATDRVDLVEHDQAQNRPDPGDRPEEGEGGRVVDLGGLHQVGFEAGDLGVVGIDQVQVSRNAQSRTQMLEPVGNLCIAVALVGQLLVERRVIILAVGVLNVGDQLSTLTDEE